MKRKLSKKTTQPDLSVVVLCYKSGELARRFYGKLAKSLESKVPNFEIVLVGNYNSSTDPTPAIVQSIAQADDRVVAVVKKKHGMMGWDMRSGLQKARGKYIAVIDGDDQFKPELIVKVYQKIAGKQLDFVKAKRIRRDDGFYRAFISFWFNTLFDMIFGAEYFSDVNSKPKIMTKQLYDQMTLTDSGWFIDAEIMIEAKRLKAAIGEVSVRFHKNKYRESFVGKDAIIEMLSKLVLYKLKEVQKQIYALSHWRNWIYWSKTSPAVQS